MSVCTVMCTRHRLQPHSCSLQLPWACSNSLKLMCLHTLHLHLPLPLQALLPLISHQMSGDSYTPCLSPAHLTLCTSAQSEPTTTVSVAAMHVPSRPTQVQINALNDQCGVIIKHGQLDICRALLTGTDGNPSLKPDQDQRSRQEEIVMAGITVTMQSVAGETVTIDHLMKENHDKIWKTIIQNLSHLWKKIKHQALADLQKLYGLLTPLGTPAKDIVIFQKHRVRTLLMGDEFLKEPGDENSPTCSLHPYSQVS